MTSPINLKNNFTNEIALSKPKEDSLKNFSPKEFFSEKTHQIALIYLGMGALGACTVIYSSDLIQGALFALETLFSLIKGTENIDSKWDMNYIIGGTVLIFLRNMALSIKNAYPLNKS